MSDDLLQYAQPSCGVDAGGLDLVPATTQVQLPDPRLKKPRHRPNAGRKRRFIGPLLETPPWDILRATGYPIPPDLKCLWRVPPQWRRGKAYQIWRKQVHDMWGYTCHLCGHGEARTSDHLVPLSQWGNQPYDARISRPAHGIEGCPTCGVKCNSSRGNKQFARAIGNYKPPVEL